MPTEFYHIIENEHRFEPIVLRPQSLNHKVVIRNVMIDGAGDAAIDIQYPSAGSWLWPTVKMDMVDIRGDWHTLVRLRNAWNTRIYDVMATGLITEETVSNPKCEVGFDLGGSMCSHVVNSFVTSAKVGVLAVDAEGIRILGGEYMHVNQGIFLVGQRQTRGRWGTPHAVIRDTHINALHHAILAVSTDGMHIIDNDLYQHHMSPGYHGVYLIDCEDAKIGNRYWSNQVERKGQAIVLVNSRRTLLDGNNTDSHLSIGVHQLAGTKYTIWGDNVWNGIPHTI